MAISNDPSDAMHAPDRDRVCGMRVDPETSRYRELHDGIAYGFCSERCRTIDLGKWASGSYVISSPVEDADESIREEDAEDSD